MGRSLKTGVDESSTFCVNTMNSLLSGAIENNIALANLKFDFSLIKVQAPDEYSELGLVLSSTRRNAAEDGALHKTARRLGCLFEQLTPSTPRLITAYGQCMSEIIREPGINPAASASHGPFAQYIGIDGTSMWAAATSGVSALGAYLLSCLLAWARDTKESTSLWVELVEERRREICDALEHNAVVSETSRYGLYQEITRKDLANWDASTRSWLRSADEAKVWELNQLMLITKNVNIPYNSGSSTYSKVITAWRGAMNGMENLLCGRPQQLSNGSSLLAIQAWHLFPELIVLGAKTTHVKFKDPLLPIHGIGTIGLQSDAPTRWSLVLSHFRHYGGPVQVVSDRDLTRVTIDQLHVVALGSLLSAWKVRSVDVQATARWICELCNFLEPATPHVQPGLPTTLGCLHRLAKAASRLALADQEVDLICL